MDQLRSPRRSLASRIAAATAVGAVAAAVSASVAAAISPVVVSQVYGGGGNVGATYTHDFIELFNRGTTSVNLTGWSVQYASATGAIWAVTPLPANVTIQPSQYYLIQEASGGAAGTPLPPPDTTGTINMSATAGKIALVSTTTAESGTCPPPTSFIVDLVGYGSTANPPSCFEGSLWAVGPSNNTTALLRLSGGCTDNDENSTDFTTGTPTPRNTASASNLCSPTAVTIRPFTVSRSAAGIALRWRTGSEAALLGFNVYREARGKLVKLNRAVIPSAFGSTATGHAYSWLDRGAP